MAANMTQVTVESVSEVPETASVCHFDEINDEVQELVVSAEKREQSQLTADSLNTVLIDECTCEIIKFTDYYRLRRL